MRTMSEDTVAKQNEVAQKVADQVVRTFSVARIKGWKFPEGSCDVGVELMAWATKAYVVKIRIGDEVLDGSITVAFEATEIADLVEELVNKWLQHNATGTPQRHS